MALPVLMRTPIRDAAQIVRLVLIVGAALLACAAAGLLSAWLAAWGFRCSGVRPKLVSFRV